MSSKVKATKAHVGVVIVSYNSAGEIGACIQSVLDQVDSLLRVTPIVVDNNSKDDSLKVATKKNAITIANGKNLGFSRAVNIGIKKAYELGCDTILILNPDAMLRAGSLKSMWQLFQTSDDIGAVGPSMVHNDGSLANEGYYLKAPSALTVGCFSTMLRPWALKKDFLVRRYEERDLVHVRNVEQVPGACIFTSKAKLDKIGLLDEDFAIWFEDVEWCYRARRKGYRMVFCPDARVVHEGGVSFAKWEGLDKSVTFYVSMKTFFRKHKPLEYPLVILFLCLNAFGVYLKNHDKNQLRFIKRFVKQRTGKLPA